MKNFFNSLCITGITLITNTALYSAQINPAQVLPPLAIRIAAPQPILQLLQSEPYYHLPTDLFNDPSYAAKMQYKRTKASMTSETAAYMTEMYKVVRAEHEKQKVMASLAALAARVRTPLYTTPYNASARVAR